MSDFSSAGEILSPFIGSYCKGIREQVLHMDTEQFTKFNQADTEIIENFEDGISDKPDYERNVKMYENFIAPSNKHIFKRGLFQDMPDID